MAKKLRRRSWLYVPAIKHRWYPRLKGLDADVFVLDLEDSVAPNKKDEARLALTEKSKDISIMGERPFFVRVNHQETQYYQRDIKTVFEIRSKLKGVVLPKVSSASEIGRLEEDIADLEIVPIIETLRGEKNASEIINASPRICCIQWGESADYSLDYRRFPKPLDAMTDPVALDFAIAILKEARIAGKEVMDGLFLDYKDAEGLKKRCEWAFDIGFEGKVAIHPDQIPIINSCFTPDEKAFEEAREIIMTYETATSNGIAPYRGSFIHKPGYLAAKKFLKKYSSNND